MLVTERDTAKRWTETIGKERGPGAYNSCRGSPHRGRGGFCTPVSSTWETSLNPQNGGGGEGQRGRDPCWAGEGAAGCVSTTRTACPTTRSPADLSRQPRGEQGGTRSSCGVAYRGSRASRRAFSTSMSSLSKSTRMTLKLASFVAPYRRAMSEMNCWTQRAWFFTAGHSHKHPSGSTWGSQKHPLPQPNQNPF